MVKREIISMERFVVLPQTNATDQMRHRELFMDLLAKKNVSLIMIVMRVFIVHHIATEMEENVCHALLVKSAQKKETQTSILANTVNITVPILVLGRMRVVMIRVIILKTNAVAV